MISVCIATYNGEKYIRSQIISILQQLSEHDEIIISDDCSTDNTIEIINNISDPRIRVFVNKRKHGVVDNFQNAIDNSKGDHIFLSDQDDIWLENKVDYVIELLEKYDCVVHNANIVDAHLTSRGNTIFEVYSSRKGILKNLYKNSYVGCCMAFSRKMLDKALPFPKSIPMHDSWIGLISEKYGNVFFMKEPLSMYRRHEDNVSCTGENSSQKFLKKILDRLNLAYWLLVR